MVTKHSLKDKKVLLTYGPTWVALDGVRVISNISSGELGSHLCQLLEKEGTHLTILRGPVQCGYQSNVVKIIPYRYYEQLARLLKTELKKKYDVIIHAAAVSDYRPKKAFRKKIESDRDQLKIDLIPTPKLINDIKKLCPGALLVGFKLEPILNPKTVQQKTRNLFNNARCDLVVMNNVKRRKYQAFIVGKNRQVLARAHSRQAICQILIRLLKERL